MVQSNIEKGRNDDEEIEFVPAIFEVTASERHKFEDGLCEEDEGENVIGELEHKRYFWSHALVVDGHLHHIEHDAGHDDDIELVSRHQRVELLSPFLLGDVRSLIHRGGRKDQPLDVLPREILGRVAFLLLLLGMVVLEEQDADEEIEEEETTDHDEYDEEEGVADRSLGPGPLFDSCCIYGLEHDVRPSLQTRYDEERTHRSRHIVKLVIVSHPLTASEFTIPHDVEGQHIDTAVLELSTK